ncbi:MAG: nucleoside deaminase [Corallococcus sp.]|nr:nucleoside deaminase [Bacillota bacterium]MCM1533501.1 nucleoside deaminase [Corallococcus sp.]
MTDERFMLEALKQARMSARLDEVPIGAVVVKNGEIIAKARNTRNKSKNAVEHAELVAIRRACKKLGDWRLNGCDLYVTLEPCVMCLGACYNARIANVYFGAYDLSGNGCIHLSEMIGRTLNHEVNICGGVSEKECSALLTEYFKSKRGNG